MKTAFEDYALGRPLKDIPTGMDGPAFHTVYRWLSMLRCSKISAWLEEKVQARGLETPPLETKSLVGRPWALAQSITRDTNSPAALIQWAKLRHLIRYGSPTYKNS